MDQPLRVVAPARLVTTRAVAAKDRRRPGAISMRLPFVRLAGEGRPRRASLATRGKGRALSATTTPLLIAPIPRLGSKPIQRIYPTPDQEVRDADPLRMTLLPSQVAGDDARLSRGCAPRNKGRRYPADPPTVEEIIAVMRTAGNSGDGVRLRAAIMILWRAGLRTGEALDLAETDLDALRVRSWVRRGRVGVRARLGWIAGRGLTIPMLWLCRSGVESRCKVPGWASLRSE